MTHLLVINIEKTREKLNSNIYFEYFEESCTESYVFKINTFVKYENRQIKSEYKRLHTSYLNIIRYITTLSDIQYNKYIILSKQLSKKYKFKKCILHIYKTNSIYP